MVVKEEKPQFTFAKETSAGGSIPYGVGQYLFPTLYHIRIQF